MKLRRLVELELSKSEPPKRPQVLSTAKQSAARARELAATTIDKHLDPAASKEERKVRKRKLVDGPSVFRDTEGIGQTSKRLFELVMKAKCAR